MKHEILLAFKQARHSHLEWLVHGARLMVDIEECEAKTPKDRQHCSFSEWYNKEGVHITKLPGLKRIDQYQADFHNAYKALYYQKFDRRSSQRQRKLFSKKYDKPSDSETSLKDKFEVLKLRYDVLEKEILALEKIVSIMNKKLFEKDRIRL